MGNLGHQSGDLSREWSDGRSGGPPVWRDAARKGPFKDLICGTILVSNPFISVLFFFQGFFFSVAIGSRFQMLPSPMIFRKNPGFFLKKTELKKSPMPYSYPNSSSLQDGRLSLSELGMSDEMDGPRRHCGHAMKLNEGGRSCFFKRQLLLLMEDILQIMGYLPDQLPQDFFHQQYEVYNGRNLGSIK